MYGGKLAYVLVPASRAPGAQDLPLLRLELLEEAVQVARALEPANPFRAKVLAMALEALRHERPAPAE